MSLAPGHDRATQFRSLVARWPGAALFLFGALGTLSLMALDRRLSHGIWAGFVLLTLAVVGLLMLFGKPCAGSERRVELRGILPSLLFGALFLLGFLVVARGLSGATLSSRQALGGAGLTGCAVGLLLVAARVHAWLCGVSRDQLLAWFGARGGLHLALLTICLFLPTLGAYGLIDPWETHYAEVARELLARDDWLSPFWAHEGFFFSKPILSFWLQAVGFGLFGVDTTPGQVMLGAQGALTYPEWAVRLPVFFLSVLGQSLLFVGLRRAFGQKSALLASLLVVLSTGWTLIMRHAMTDGPMIATLTGALGCFLAGLATEADQKAPSLAIGIGTRTLSLSMTSLVLGAVTLLGLPQILLLLSRNLTLVTRVPDWGFAWHTDRFYFGSGGGNCGLPGNPKCHWVEVAHPFLQPGWLALAWFLALLTLLWWKRGEQREAHLFFLGGWMLLALSTLAKGLPGLVIGSSALLAVLLVSGWRRAWSRLELGPAILVFAVIAAPWFVQMVLRHGMPFVDRLFLHDMVRRAFEHVHDTNADDDTSLRYYIWQLGYALFPATGLAIGAWLSLGYAAFEGQTRKKQSVQLLCFWALAGFGMVSISLTKFHHYILPIVPAVAATTGLFVARALPNPSFPRGARAVPYTLGIVLSVGLAALSTKRLLDGGHTLGAYTFLVFLLLLAGSVGLATARLLPTLSGRPSRAARAALVFVGLVGAGLVVLVGRDLMVRLPEEVPGSARLFHLICYSYARSFPPVLDWSTFFAAVTLLAAGFSVALAVSRSNRVRVHLVACQLGLMVLFSGFVANFYLPAVSTHFGQRELIGRYYRTRASTEEPLAAYQMNWKGENFYTGNRLATFITSGEPFQTWLDEQENAHRTAVFVVLEHTRLAYLKSEVGEERAIEELTTAHDNDKFLLVRVRL